MKTSQATAAVRLLPSTNGWLRAKQVEEAGEVLIITGRGNQSEGQVAVVREAVLSHELRDVLLHGGRRHEQTHHRLLVSTLELPMLNPITNRHAPLLLCVDNTNDRSMRVVNTLCQASPRA